MAQSNGPPVPANLPVPQDDGAATHLTSSKLPSVALPSTAGNKVDVSTLAGLSIIFCYPRTGGPDENIPAEWDAIPGARGCTPQACSFRDASYRFLADGVSHIFGVSTQDTEYQSEIKERVHLPYQLLSDEKLELAGQLNLPTFEWRGQKLLKRLTMAVEDGIIVKVWYPVFPPDKSADEVLSWLETKVGRQGLGTKAEEDILRSMGQQ
ncbi:hypothetical protein Q7P37_004751 [Cladosporium fusiforme]